jgi:hypothetical protein
VDTPISLATPSLVIHPLSPGAAHELTLVVANGLEELEIQRQAYSLPQQLALISGTSLLSDLRIITRQHPYSGVATECSDVWLCAAVLVLKSPTLLLAGTGWSVAGTPPSLQLFRVAKTLCNLVPHLRHLTALVERLEPRKGELA